MEGVVEPGVSYTMSGHSDSNANFWAYWVLLSGSTAVTADQCKSR